MRLPVILVENPPAAGASLAESLVGNLIGRAGLDLTLVDRFDSLSENSTDRMTLDGITVPSAVLDWRSPEETQQVLASISFHGMRTPHRLDPLVPSGTGDSNRRLFLFDLTKHRDALSIVAELDRLRESLSVKTVALGSMVAPKSSGGGRSVEPANRPPLDVLPMDVPHPSEDAPSPGVAVRGVVRSDENLSQLIDQLDELDI